MQPGPELAGDTSSAADETIVFGNPDDGLDGVVQPDFLTETILEQTPSNLTDAGDIVDAEIVEETAPVEEKPRRTRRPRKSTTDIDAPLIDPEKDKGKKGAAPKSGIPDVDEWKDFVSRIVLRTFLDWYVDYVFRGINEDIVTDRDLERLTLTKEERDEIAAPFAEYANKNKFTRKHGREIVALADSLESAIILTRYIARVNRIARKYKPKQAKRPSRTTLRPEGAANGNIGPDSQEFVGGANGGRFPNGYGVYNPGGS